MEDLTNKEFGDYVVLNEKRKLNNDSHYAWNCKCKKCGKTRWFRKREMKPNCLCKNDEHSSHTTIRKGKNRYRYCGDYVYVRLSNTNDEMICDADVWERLKQYTWHKAKSGYVGTNYYGNEHKYMLFHRAIFNIENGLIVDHINHNRLDNRIENLRYTTYQGNNINKRSTSNNSSSGMNGIYWDVKREKWIVELSLNSKCYYFGGYEELDEAVKRRDEVKAFLHKPILDELSINFTTIKENMTYELE